MPCCLTPWREPQYPLHRRLGGPQSRSGRGSSWTVIIWCLRFDSQMAAYRCIVKRILLLVYLLHTFVTEKDKTVTQLCGGKRVMALAFVVDITTRLTELSVSLKRTTQITCDVCWGLKVFEAEPNLLDKHNGEQYLVLVPSCRSVPNLPPHHVTGIIQQLQN
jgi:hypothetical protein